MSINDYLSTAAVQLRQDSSAHYQALVCKAHYDISCGRCWRRQSRIHSVADARAQILERVKQIAEKEGYVLEK